MTGRAGTAATDVQPLRGPRSSFSSVDVALIGSPRKPPWQCHYYDITFSPTGAPERAPPPRNTELPMYVSPTDLAFAGPRHASVAAANFGGIANRLRCLMTCNAFSTGTPIAYWDGNWSGHPIQEYPAEEAEAVFSIPLLPAVSLRSDDRPFYDSWIVLNREIMEAGKATAALCIDALNGDGLKSAQLLYQIPDPIFQSLRSNLMELLSRDFLQKIERLTDFCQGIDYAVISMRFWIDCPSSFHIEDLGTRLAINWSNKDEFEKMLRSVENWKIGRLPPSVTALCSIRQYIRKLGINNVVLMSDRWSGINFYSGQIRKLENILSTEFHSGIERQIANMFVIAYSKFLGRSKDSTFTHLPLLLREKWSIKIIDM